MARTYFVGIVALALASPILNYPMVNVVAAPSRAAPVVEAGLQRYPNGAAKATRASLPSVSTIVDGTAQCTSLATCPRATSFILQQPPKWGLGEIENVVFGIIAAILGTLTIGLTYFLYIRNSQRHQSAEPTAASDVSTSGTPTIDDPIPLQDFWPVDLPPSYASVLDSTYSTDRDAI